MLTSPHMSLFGRKKTICNSDSRGGKECNRRLKRTRYFRLDEGWDIINEQGIQKLWQILVNSPFDAASYEVLKQQQANLNSHCFKLCNQREPYNWTALLYDRRNVAITDFIQGICVPAIQVCSSVSLS